MKRAWFYDYDFKCPHCGTPLKVEDPDDFCAVYGLMEREEEHTAECPSCERLFTFHVVWQPSYPYEPKAVNE